MFLQSKGNSGKYEQNNYHTQVYILRLEMKVSVDSAVVRKVEDSLSIVSLFDGEDFSFDFVIGKLNWFHWMYKNTVSDRAYFVLDWVWEITVDETTYSVAKWDLVTVKSGSTHWLSWEMDYIIITSPPYDPKNEPKV